MPALRAAAAGPRARGGDGQKTRAVARDLFDAAARHRTELVHAPFYGVRCVILQTSAPTRSIHANCGRAAELLANPSGCRGRGGGQDVETGMPCARGAYAALACCQCQRSWPTRPCSANSPAASPRGKPKTLLVALDVSASATSIHRIGRITEI